MRVLIPNHCSPDTFVDNVAHSLRSLGHDVLTLPAVAQGPLARVQRIVIQLGAKALPAIRMHRERQVIELARCFKPELVLTLTQPLLDETLRELRRLGARWSVAWWGDAPANMAEMGLLSDEWTAIFLKDVDAVAKFRRVGLNAHLLHEAMNPNWHRPLAERSNQNIVVAGNYYGYRQFLVSRLVRDGYTVELHGSKLPRWGHRELQRLHSGRFITREEKSIVFGEASVCLNSMSLAEGNSLNCRAFEIAGAGGLQLIENRPIISDCFEPGRELLTFDTYDELRESIDRGLRDGCAEIRRAGAARALAQHTYQHRLASIGKVAEVPGLVPI